MRSKNSDPITRQEREHLARVKSQPCAVCGEGHESEAHHIKQGNHWTCIALCSSCHRSPKLGIHGEKLAWRVRKMDELDALAETLRRMHE